MGAQDIRSRLIELARNLGVAQNPLIRQRLADLYAQIQVARFTAMRAEARLKAGSPPGPELSTRG